MIPKDPTPTLLERFFRKTSGWKLTSYSRLIPISFALGAIVELVRIHWTPLGINFYTTYVPKRRQQLLDDFRRALETENENKLRQFEDEVLKKSLTANSGE